ncbi:PadR family transcriptional regulator [Natrinema salsiterrestre]|uniref:PadR family transcriptional regulator n=1 Tax=Natrinema salsiterrestre TaxID=2950540 RepID=A0A9Q4PZG0_9EURY|nr:PadR family transcriptional regulator [Natrinema salsiterrestre]MDF9744795.1 PadR family transcriptional regulator [Natrinema salsiterrestre]
MSDDDSRSLEPPARAAESPHDEHPPDRHTWIELTGFQRDCLEAVARRERDGYAGYPSGIKWALERWYPAVGRARLEPNLRALVGRGLVAPRDDQSGGVPAYRLTDAGRALLGRQADRLAVFRGAQAEGDDAMEEGGAREKQMDRPTETRDDP